VNLAFITNNHISPLYCLLFSNLTSIFLLQAQPYHSEVKLYYRELQLQLKTNPVDFLSFLNLPLPFVTQSVFRVAYSHSFRFLQDLSRSALCHLQWGAFQCLWRIDREWAAYFQFSYPNFQGIAIWSDSFVYH